MRANVLVVPVFQKHWLYHVWSEANAAEAAALHWTQGSSLPEKAALLGKDLGHRFSAVAKRQWESLQAADEGSFKNRLYRLAQWVLSREDPTETFLKSIPRDASSLLVIHPSTLKERLVRRRLRRMALAQEHFHNRRILGWALATLPQLPLVITPLPNVTLYYTAYKMMSHYQALQGCRTLRAAFELYDEEEQARAAGLAAAGRDGQGSRKGWLARLRFPIPELHTDRASGGSSRGVAPRDGSAHPHGSPSPSFSRDATAVRRGGRAKALTAPLPEFKASRELDKVVQPLERWQSPLPDEKAQRVRDLFQPLRKASKGDAGDGGAEEAEAINGVEAVPELVARLRRQVLERGGMGKSSCSNSSACRGKS